MRKKAAPLEGVEPIRASSKPQPELDGRINLANFDRVRSYLDVSRSTLLRHIYGRKITAIKIGGEWKFRWEDVERFVQKRTRRAA